MTGRWCYVVRLRCKRTGKETRLGYRFDTRAEAEAHIEDQVCTQCNTADVVPTPLEAARP